MASAVVAVMDDIAEINIKKDTTFALLLEARRRQLPLWYGNETDLELDQGQCVATLRALEVHDDPEGWFELGDRVRRPLDQGDLVLMRCDPPVDDAYLFATYLLERAVVQGARVINHPRALRDFNEKLATARFAHLMPPTRVSSQAASIREFVEQHGRCVIKPLNGMGGQGVFLANPDDQNLNVIIETVTAAATLPAMVQAFVPEIAEGDKRILIIQGEPVPWVLARRPGGRDFRGNLARGGRGEGRPLSAGDRQIAAEVGPVLVEHGIAFAGLDVIGDRLTEINVTSPTCVRELDRQFGINIAGSLYDALGLADSAGGSL